VARTSFEPRVIRIVLHRAMDVQYGTIEVPRSFYRDGDGGMRGFPSEHELLTTLRTHLPDGWHVHMGIRIYQGNEVIEVSPPPLRNIRITLCLGESND